MYKPVCRGCFFLKNPKELKIQADVPDPKKQTKIEEVPS